MSGDGTFDISVINNYIKKASDLGIYGVDIGAFSTRPDGNYVTAEEEMSRLQYELPRTIKLCHSLGVKVSLDSFRAEILEFGLKKGIDYINDVTGFKDQKIIDLALKYTKAKCIAMHSLSVPVVKGEVVKTDNIVQFIIDWGNKKIKTLAALKERIIIDIGIGFGLTREQNFELLRNIKTIKKSINAPIYVGHSRKSFLNEITTDIAQKDVLTSIINQDLMTSGCDYIRVHNLDYASLNSLLLCSKYNTK